MQKPTNEVSVSLNVFAFQRLTFIYFANIYHLNVTQIAYFKRYYFVFTFRWKYNLGRVMHL